MAQQHNTHLTHTFHNSEIKILSKLLTRGDKPQHATVPHPTIILSYHQQRIVPGRKLSYEKQGWLFGRICIFSTELGTQIILHRTRYHSTDNTTQDKISLHR